MKREIPRVEEWYCDLCFKQIPVGPIPQPPTLEIPWGSDEINSYGLAWCSLHCCHDCLREFYLEILPILKKIRSYNKPKEWMYPWEFRSTRRLYTSTGKGIPST